MRIRRHATVLRRIAELERDIYGPKDGRDCYWIVDVGMTKSGLLLNFGTEAEATAVHERIAAAIAEGATAVEAHGHTLVVAHIQSLGNPRRVSL